MGSLRVHHNVVEHIGGVRAFVPEKLEQVAVLVRQSARVAGGQPPAAVAALRFDDFDVAHVFCRTIFVMISQPTRALQKAPPKIGDGTVAGGALWRFYPLNRHARA